MSVTSIDLPSARRQRKGVETHKEPDKMRRRVLVADDSSDGRRMISGILGCLGLEVAVAENGRVACDAALSAWRRGEPFDLILMDLQMPVIDGYEATALLRASGYAGRVVALTSDCAFLGTHEKCLKAGCDGYATKPITFEMLDGVVRRYLPQPRQALRKVSA